MQLENIKKMQLKKVSQRISP